MKYIKVAVPRPLDGLFDYEHSEEDLGDVHVGDWVQVPLGRSQVVGIVLEVSSQKPELEKKIQLKKTIQKISEDLSLPEEVIRLCRFAAEYYQYPIGEAFFAAMPPAPTKDLKTRKSKENKIETKPIQLNEEQAVVVQIVLKNIFQNNKTAFLLEGVTGSGKTEVYIEIVKSILNTQKSVLILVPEIALTVQLKQRFEQALGEPVTLWHSALADGLKQVQWKKIKSGEIKVVIGARSAIFAPLKNLGLIVVDEEHDQTYKQEERFRYQARDLALYRAHQQKAPIILGSATPSLESLQKVEDGKLVHLQIKKRFSGQVLPEIKLISLSQEQQVIHEKVKTPFAEKTIQIMNDVLKRANKLLFF